MELVEAIKKARRVYICGNGGSAANAMHIANDLISCGIKAHALTADVATLTAIANDYGYQHIFSRQLAVLGEPGDLLIVLSGSGNSQNVIAALLEAERIGMETYAIVGNFEQIGEAARIAAHAKVYGHGMQSAEAAQIVFGHEAMLCLKSS